MKKVADVIKKVIEILCLIVCGMFIFIGILLFTAANSHNVSAGLLSLAFALLFALPAIVFEREKYLQKKSGNSPAPQNINTSADYPQQYDLPQELRDPPPAAQQGITISPAELLMMKIDSLSTSGTFFENAFCWVLHDNGFINISTTPATNDYGIDILAEKDGISYAIQCKCYSSPVGNKAVQEAYTGKDYYKKMIAVVATNNTFTRSAIDTARATQVLLWDRQKVMEMISRTSDEAIRAVLNEV
uniref:Restriction endonuclease n=1 Tax=Siphoviridae sp. ctXBp18 TaxID=2825541 RepID=A0A8S5PK52_9CAUD|nr:MAG TPA: Restriction endonuclease [Siphoviridae sp. ctXBp18]